MRNLFEGILAVLGSLLGIIVSIISGIVAASVSVVGLLAMGVSVGLIALIIGGGCILVYVFMLFM